ncbi:hypothetical protein Hhel01_00626 [Haloferula helveola]
MFLPWLCGAGLAAGQQVDLWDLPPMRYSETEPTDAVAALARGLERGEIQAEGATGLEKLRFVLKVLNVPESSQTLVFSKTSKQISRIHPGNPRALYFSEEAYVGYVPGGAIEVIAQDPVLGPVFYLVEAGGPTGLVFDRDTSDCFSCHGTTRTENVPGMLIRSVFPDRDGRPLLSLGSVTVTHETPIEERWGGYYVTGSSDHPHFGNSFFEEGGPTEPSSEDVDDLSERIDVAKYPRGTSDIVALAVLEHQVNLHNLMTAARVRYGRARYLSQAIDPSSNPDEGQAGRIADTMASKIVDALLFRNEADLGDGIEGDDAFQRDYGARFPRTESGESLADFKLYRRLFKNRCSCMIYSQAFRGMPATVSERTLARLRGALSDGDDSIAPHLSGSEKQRIREILDETFPDWKEKG